MEPLRSLLASPAPVHRGFSLVEMLVVLAIIAAITTITLFGQSSFNRSLLLTDSAYTLALSLRQMQSYGLSSRKTTTGIQNAGYGAHFAAATPTSYILFGDTNAVQALPANCSVGTVGLPDAKPGNCLYDSTAPTDVIVQTYTLSRGFMVSDFCGRDSSNARHCKSDGSISALDIVFLRPNTETVMNALQPSGAWMNLTSAEVYIQSADGVGTRGICVSRVGQVSVATSTCS